MKYVKLSLFLILSLAQLTNLYGQKTVGVTSSIKSEISPGYNLFFSHRQSSTYLVDNDGEVVNTWVDGDNFNPGNSVYLLESGLLVRCKRPDGRIVWGGGEGGTVDIVDWDGTVLSSFTLNNDQFRLHHDVAPMPSGNILMIAWERISETDAIASGRDPEIITQGAVFSEKILEWDPTSNSIVWEWRAWDHLVQDKFPNLPNFGIVNQSKERINVNYDTHNAHPDWLHINSIAYNVALDQIVLSVPYFDEFWIIDHSTSTEEAKESSGGNAGKGGDLVYRWGNPHAYQAEANLPQQLFFQHDVHWKNPNAVLGDSDFGKILLFNNRMPEGTSVGNLIQTIDPSTSDYFIDDTEASQTGILKTYSHPTSANIAVSSGLSSVQALPNGNTLMFAGRNGYGYELNPRGEIVWEYRIPLKSGQPVPQGTILGTNDNITFRLNRYPTDFAAFEGRDLTPKGLLEEVIQSPVPTIEFNSASGNGSESISTANLQINLSESITENIIVYYSVSGTALNGGTDYTLADGTLIIPAGNTVSSIDISNIIDDEHNEADETVIVMLSNPGNATLGIDSIYTYTINDNDAVPTIGFTQSSSDGSESVSNANLQVDLSAISGQEVTVDYTVTGTATGNGTDYSLASGTLAITAGNSNNNIIATIVDDVLVEDTETLIVMLSDPVNAILSDNLEHTYTIIDNDRAILRVDGGNEIPITRIGLTSLFNLIIYNEGNIDLTISDISYPEGFDSNPGPITVSESDTVTIVVGFSPLEEKIYSGNVVFTSNSDEGQLEYNLSAEGRLVTSIDNGFIDSSLIELYPSPADNILSLNLSQLDGQTSWVVIFDSKGQQLYGKSEFNEKVIEIDVSHYNEGIYIAHIQIEQSIVVKKFIIRR